MKFLPTLVAILLVSCHALYQDEAGKLDFLISTAGHGPPTYVQTAGESFVITSSSSSCYVGSRKIEDGSLAWRRYVCSTRSLEVTHATTVVGGAVVTADSHGAVRAWAIDSGALLWDAKLDGAALPAVWPVGETYVAVASGASSTVVLEASTGSVIDNAPKVTKPGKVDRAILDATCMESKTSLKAQGRFLVATPGETRIDMNLSELDEIASMVLVRCDAASISVLVTTKRGMVTRIAYAADSLHTVWKVEEGLADVSSAILVDQSHFAEDIDESKEKELLQLRSRINAQIQNFKGMLSLTWLSRQTQAFGFEKVAVLLSKSANRIYGIGTVGSSRAQVIYVIDLPEDAEWHRLIHGSVNPETAHTVSPTAHIRELLVVSARDQGKKLSWVCIDGASGSVHSKGETSVAAPVLQVIPFLGTGDCRQSAALVLQDKSLVVIPEHAFGDFKDQILFSNKGLFSHVWDKQKSSLETYRMVGDASGGTPQLVGSATFPGEDIVTVSYPIRDDVVQSPCNVLGDESLLLKYLNPHIAVVVTMKSSGSEKDWLKKTEDAKKGGQKRKPAGAGNEPDAEAVVEYKPNLFVNVVDTISGRVLYRASHANVAASPRPTAVISENWVFYSFVNEKTRRAEIGVLSLYEGMIDSTSLTAFTSPEQSKSFSSFDAKESKPVVLAKTYTLTKPVTALGVTTTRSGISTRRLLLATLDGQIHAVEKKMLEPRRPIGQVKESEKKEGLHQYSELIPMVPLMSLSYNQTVDSVQSIVTTATDLESQTIVLAYGGPDIFYTRTSPARGFDLLPDSFSRPLLSLIVIALVAVVVVLQQVVSKKIKKQGWM